MQLTAGIAIPQTSAAGARLLDTTIMSSLQDFGWLLSEVEELS
jgi:hypothetical protein